MTDMNWEAAVAAITDWRPDHKKKRSGKSYTVGNECVFQFARMLKGVSGIETLEPGYRRDVVAVWWDTHQDTILQQPDGPKTLDQAQLQFDAVWPKVKYAPGQLERVIAEKARTEQPPEAEQFTDPVIRLLVSACYHLQELSGSEPFYLAGSTAGRICGRTQAWAAPVLQGLVARKILTEVKKGTTKKATRYRYVSQDGITQHRIGGPDPGVTCALIKVYRILISNRDFEPTPKQMPKFMVATEKVLALAKKANLKLTTVLNCLSKCLELEYRQCGKRISVGHLCSKRTWDELIPQHLDDVGLT